jgi:hypothetical protein
MYGKWEVLFSIRSLTTLSHTMDGREITGVDVSVVPLIGSFRNIMAFFTSFQGARSSALELEKNILAMEILHLRFSRWGAALKFSGGVANPKELHAAVRYRTDVAAAKEVLARIASRFEDIAKITKGRKVESVVSTATGSYSTTSEALIQRMRELAHSRQCKANPLSKVHWYLMLERIRKKSFRRQCRLATAKANWIFSKEDKSRIAKLAKELAELMDSLEDYVSGDDTIIRSCYDEEVSKVLLVAPPGSPQLSSLRNALLRRDDRLQEAIAHRERGTVAGNPLVNENGFF